MAIIKRVKSLDIKVLNIANRITYIVLVFKPYEYIYIYTYIYVCVCMYIYIVRNSNIYNVCMYMYIVVRNSKIDIHLVK